MQSESIESLQLDLFGASSAHHQAIETYELIRPVLTQQRTLAEQSRHTGIAYKRLWRYWHRFQDQGIWGLLDGRTRGHHRGQPPIEQILPQPVQHQILRLAQAHPFTYRELARLVEECYGHRVNHHGIRRLLEHHHLSAETLAQLHQQGQQAPLPPPLPAPAQMELLLTPRSWAQRLLHALGPEHLLIRFRTYREYPTEEQARWRIIELLDVGFRPRRVAKLLVIRPVVVYYWKRRFKEAGLLGLSTRQRADTPITRRVSVQVMMEVFQLLDNNPLLGHYRVKMALDSLGYRYGHTTVWQMVAFYKQGHPGPPPEKRNPNPDERPKGATQPHQVWFVDLRYLVQIEGQWLYSILIFDGYSRALVGEGCFDRQDFSHLVQVFRQALARWGAPERVVSDNAKIFVALAPCLEKLAIDWAPIPKRRPWQNLAEGGFSIQRRMLDAYVVGCTDPQIVYQRHAQFVQDYQFWGHWAHKRTDAQGRIYYLSPEVILGQATGRPVAPTRLRYVFRLRQVQRLVRAQGQIRLHHFGLYVDRGLSGQHVDALIYDDAVRIEQDDQLIVSYPCRYDPQQRRITSVDEHGRQQYRRFRLRQLLLFTLGMARWVWKMPPYRRLRRRPSKNQGRQLHLWAGKGT
ncbi:MAG TPA: helix-turn-helix domain-containing protein [Anaerolineae bacterium]|nr:helix-turn-helix domain-containing protein [Anaerolineae bacterium]